MDTNAATKALKEVGSVLAKGLAGAIALTAAIWIPTLLLQHYVFEGDERQRFLQAYLFGLPAGILFLCLVSIFYMRYQSEARKARP